MYRFYRFLTACSAPFLSLLLKRRAQKGKEDTARLDERRGKPTRPRPNGPLVWVHAASVGEAQSALILVEALLKAYKNTHVLVTTGTRTSAHMMDKNLPDRAFHQYVPLDHPRWIINFLDHWRPSVALWMESEFWPNMLHEIKVRHIPAALINARLSDRSYKNWGRLPSLAGKMMSTFNVIIAQTIQDQNRLKRFYSGEVIVSDNLKYSAVPLPYSEQNLNAISSALGKRPVWLYASTHKGEEALACRLHEKLKKTMPDLLTIIVPRHPARRDDIKEICKDFSITTVFRHPKKTLPEDKTDIYVADTLGELGLFYRLAPVACIGRSFSNDGGGGHNPIEAAQLGCVVLHGPHVQYQAQLYHDMHQAEAALLVQNEIEFFDKLNILLHNQDMMSRQQERGYSFAKAKMDIIDVVMDGLGPVLAKGSLS